VKVCFYCRLTEQGEVTLLVTNLSALPNRDHVAMLPAPAHMGLGALARFRVVQVTWHPMGEHPSFDVAILVEEA